MTGKAVLWFAKDSWLILMRDFDLGPQGTTCEMEIARDHHYPWCLRRDSGKTASTSQCYGSSLRHTRNARSLPYQDGASLQMSSLLARSPSERSELMPLPTGGGYCSWISQWHNPFSVMLQRSQRPEGRLIYLVL